SGKGFSSPSANPLFRANARQSRYNATDGPNARAMARTARHVITEGSARARTSMLAPTETRMPIPDCLVFTMAASTSASGASDFGQARPLARSPSMSAASQTANSAVTASGVSPYGDRWNRGTNPGFSGPISNRAMAQAHQGGARSGPARARAISNAAA